MGKWHYLSKELDLEILKNAYMLNELGEIGWELIHLEKITGSKWLALFKKPEP